MPDLFIKAGIGALQGHPVLRPSLGCDPARMADITSTAPEPTPSTPTPRRGRHQRQPGHPPVPLWPDRQGQATATPGNAPTARAAPAPHRVLAGALGNEREDTDPTHTVPMPRPARTGSSHQADTSDARTATADSNDPVPRRPGRACCTAAGICDGRSRVSPRGHAARQARPGGGRRPTRGAAGRRGGRSSGRAGRRGGPRPSRKSAAGGTGRPMRPGRRAVGRSCVLHLGVLPLRTVWWGVERV